MRINKCDLCGSIDESKVKWLDSVEFGRWTENHEDWDALQNWDICKKCKNKIKKFILSLKKNTQSRSNKSEKETKNE